MNVKLDERYDLYINGTWVPASDGRVFTTTNPATGEKLAALEFPAPETAYLYGFLCHFALDRACHGYIAGQIARSGVAHTEIEVEFDRSLLVQAGLDPIRTSLTGHLHASARSAAVMAELLPDELTPRQTEQAIRTFLWGNALFLAPGRAKRTALYAGMHLAGAYHGLHGMIVNYEPNPKCAESNLVLQRLFDEAVPQAVTLITEYLPCIRGELPWSGLYDYTFGGVRV